MRNACGFLFGLSVALGMAVGVSAGAFGDEKPNLPAGVGLDPARNYALESVSLNGCAYASAGTFPLFTCLDVTGGVFAVSGSDARWKVRKTEEGVTYACRGLEVRVDYRAKPDGSLAVTTRVLREGVWRLLSVGDAGGLLVLPRDEKADVSFVSCADGGRLYVRPTAWRQARFGSPIQANFVALLHDGRGLLLHPDHHAYGLGFGARGNCYGLGCEQFFRPSRTTQFAMPLCHEALSFTLMPLTDANGDGEVNWIDAGVAYRDRYIKPNRHLDAALRDGPGGKLRWKPIPELRRTLEQIRRDVKEVPITIWMLAPAGPSSDFLPSAAVRKEWRELKREMARINIRLSPHDNLDDIAPEIAAADPGHIRWDNTLRLMPAYRDCFRRALNDEAYVSAAVKARLNAWSARRGDTWHIDVFANAPFEDYCPAHPSTFETDFQNRYAWFRMIHDERGVHVTSEFLDEGYHEVCDYGWWALAWNDCAADERRIPLLPVLFLGRTYYGTFNPAAKTWVNRDTPRGHPNVGESLLWGVKVHTDLPDEFAPLYEAQNRFWAQIADKTVRTITLRDGWWRVLYSDGCALRVRENGGRWEEMRAASFVFEPAK